MESRTFAGRSRGGGTSPSTSGRYLYEKIQNFTVGAKLASEQLVLFAGVAIVSLRFFEDRRRIDDRQLRFRAMK